MSISLNTNLTDAGVVCTFADTGEYAGIVRSSITKGGGIEWLACPAFGFGVNQLFSDLIAAEYLILAWAIEARAKSLSVAG